MLGFQLGIPIYLFINGFQMYVVRNDLSMFATAVSLKSRFMGKVGIWLNYFRLHRDVFNNNLIIAMN